MILFVVISILTLFTVCFLIALPFAIIDGHKTAKEIAKLVLEKDKQDKQDKPGNG